MTENPLLRRGAVAEGAKMMSTETGELTTDLADFVRRDYRFNGVSKPVLQTGLSGPAIVVIHEIFGFTPALARLCRWLRDAGFSVHAPILIGKPDASNEDVLRPSRILSLCVSREFNLFAENRASPIVDWLKPLARQLHQEFGGPGVGVIGMCLTGGFALNMAVDGSVVAPVLAQPSLPVGKAAGLDVSPQDVAAVQARVAQEGLSFRGFRFEGDLSCQAPRFERLQALLGDGFLGVVLPDAAANPDGMKAKGRPPHSVFTGDLIDAPDQLTRQAVDDLIAFYRARLLSQPG